MIRIAQTLKPDILAQLNKEVQEIHHHLYPNVFKPFSYKEIKDFYRLALKEGAVAFVAYWQEEPVGYIVLIEKKIPENAFQYPQQFLLIDQIGVLASYRNRGIASALINKGEEFAQEAGIRSMRLNHWSLNNAAKAVFKRNGFGYVNENMEKLIPLSE